MTKFAPWYFYIFVLVACYKHISPYLRWDKRCILVAVCSWPAWWNVDLGKAIKYVTKTVCWVNHVYTIYLPCSIGTCFQDLPELFTAVQSFSYSLYLFPALQRLNVTFYVYVVFTVTVDGVQMKLETLQTIIFVNTSFLNPISPTLSLFIKQFNLEVLLLFQCQFQNVFKDKSRR